jgi:LCP family protein required for cell wall assembly
MAKSDEVTQHGKLRKRSTTRSAFALLGIVIAVVVASATSVTAVAVAQIAGNLEGNNGGPSIQIHSKIPVPPTIGAYPGGFNILIVGSDTRVGQGGIGGKETSILNDVTMLLHVSADHKFATAVSFPRDMVVPIPSCAAGGPAAGLPINTALFYGGSTDAHPGAGLPCVVKTVEQFTGVPIQFAGLITFTGVVEITNAIGGVPVCVVGNINDPEVGLHLSAGTHTISGLTALEFLRSRHGVGDGSDLGRISSQQVYLSSLVRTIEGENLLGNIPLVYKLAQAATSNMELSAGFNTPDALFAIAQALKGIPLSNIVFVQYPGSTSGTGIYSGKVQPNLALGNQLFALIKADQKFKIGSGGTDLGSVQNTNAPKPTASAAPPTTNTNVATLNGVEGQSSADYTCSKAFHE